ncbi:hypothetical protein ACFY93_10205 [Streptomyces sp. NPDC008313]|uniref:hypothetical protein n=1 Tax=Streptomyces sp. NPDC008313 TaxID=3364826 RepID=UPI0036EFC0F1
MTQERPEDVPAEPAPQQGSSPAGAAVPPQRSAPGSPPVAGYQPPPPPHPAPAPAPYPGASPASGGTPAGAAPPAYPYTQPAAQYPAPPVPPPPGATGTAGRAVLWAAVGAVAASALWAGGLFVVADGSDADLAGYRSRANLCAAVDYASLRSEYPERDTAPTHHSLKHEALDQSDCSISLKTASSSAYADAYLSVQVDLHKKSDPGPEFTALWSKYDQRYTGYEVREVSGFGDEAYLVTEDATSGSGTSGSRAVILAVRDGWMTYQMSWSAYTTSSDTEPPDVTDISRLVKDDSQATLDNLR